MALTKQQIRDRSAEMLGFNPIRQPLESNIASRIEQAYDEIYEILKEEGLAIWGSSGNVPNKLAPFVIYLVAQNCISLGTTPERISIINIGAQEATSNIRRYVTPDYASQEEAKDY